MEPSTPRAFADAYVATVNRGAYSDLASLFAPDAVFLAPGNRVFRGRAEISAFYESFLAEVTPTIRISSYVEQGSDCVYELEARINGETDFSLGAIDHAMLDENGSVTRFSVFTK